MWAQGNHAIPLPMPEAAGAAAGGPEDASTGLPTGSDERGALWAFNSPMGEWQRIHTIRSGDTLFNLSGTYYGTRSVVGVRKIHNVPQNRAIQGPSPDRGLIPGDRILIPGLTQPAPPPVEVESPGPVEVPNVPIPGEPGIGTPPPDEITVPTIPTDGFPVPDIPGDIIPIGAPAEPEEPSERTPPKKKSDKTLLIAGAVGVGALLIGGAALMMRKRKRKQNPRRKRRR